MQKVIPLRLISRTSSTADWNCPRAFYNGYLYGGVGLAKESTSLALATGISIHDSLATIATFHDSGIKVPIDDIANLAFKQMYDALLEGQGEFPAEDSETYAREQATLTEGLIRGFYKHVWPRLTAIYPKIVAVEKEVEYPLDSAGQYVFMAKPDLLMEDYSGDWHYIEYKSTSSKKSEWINSWDTAVQLHSSVKAVEKTMGKTPVDVTVVGLYKGYYAYNRQQSPLCYGYVRKGNPPFTTDQVSYEYKSGLKRVPTWEMEGGVQAWVEAMPEDTLGNMFPMTPPISVNDDLVEAFFRQRLIREQEVVRGLQDLALGRDEQATLDRYWPQKWDKCRPAWGYPCEFLKLCHAGVRDPLKEGFVPRTPHHKREEEALGVKNE